MTLRSTGLSLVFASLATTAFAAADANSFALVSSTGKTLGKASYTIDKTKDGFRVRCKFQYRLAASDVQALTNTADDLPQSGRHGGAALGVEEAQYSGEYKISATGDFLTGFTQNGSTQMLTSYQPDKKGETLTIGQVQAGVSGGSRDLQLPSPHFLLTPDYDPSALQVLLTTALTHPHPDSTYALVIPSGPNARARGNNSLYVTLQPDLAISAHGTLADKPIVLKHYLLNYHEGHADLYADADGNLMEADLGPLGAKYIRTGFTLAP